MIILTREAEAQVDALLKHYEKKLRPEASRNLLLTLQEASEKIEADPQGGAVAPGPYPDLARYGFLWIRVRAYWIAYDIAAGADPIIAAVFYVTANMPRRMRLLQRHPTAIRLHRGKARVTN